MWGKSVVQPGPCHYFANGQNVRQFQIQFSQCEIHLWVHLDCRPKAQRRLRNLAWIRLGDRRYRDSAPAKSSLAAFLESYRGYRGLACPLVVAA